jgi:ribosome-associated protein
MPSEGPERLRVTRSCAIPLAELAWRYNTSGGPGGQHANRSQTRAEVSFDITASEALGPRQRARLIERLGPVVRAAASDERSQLRNRELALDRLRAKLAAGLAVQPDRHPTGPTRGSQERRLDAKRRQGLRKSERRIQPLDE